MFSFRKKNDLSNRLKPYGYPSWMKIARLYNFRERLAPR